MDTKWKKSKCAVSFLCFVLGVSLLLTGAALFFSGVFQGEWGSFTEALKGDYQNTEQFQSLMEDKLRYFLRYAIGLEDGTEEAALDGQNLLYQVTRDGQTVCSNTSILTPTGDLPEDYNFQLYFDGEAVTIWKDGKEVDVYGDGYYRPENGDWFVPGYQNIALKNFVGSWGSLEIWDSTAPTATDMPIPSPEPAISSAPLDTQLPETVQDSWEQAVHAVRIYLAAAEEPVYWGYWSSSADPLYLLVQNHQRDQQVFLVLSLIPAIGLALFIVYLVLRKAKAQADRAIAWVTGKIWLEIKLLLLIPLIILLGLSFHVVFPYIFYGWQYSEILLAFPTFWWCYLYINDLRYNGTGAFRNSFCAWCVRLFRVSGLNYPVQTRLVRRANWQFAATLPFIIGAALLWLLIFFNIRWYFSWFSGLLLLFLLLAGLALVAVQVLLLRRQHANAADLGLLLDRIQAVHDGKLDGAPVLPEDGDLRQAEDTLADIQAGMKAALAEQTRSERMKVELIANVSHDLKTPLTSIISYAELLSRETGLPDHVMDYIRILNDKSVRLKSMVQEVFEVSKAASGNLPVNLEALDLAKLLRQTLADMQEAVSGSSLTFRVQLPDQPVFIKADGDRLYRVFQNLIQNALQYSLEGSRVFLNLRLEKGRAVVRTQNISRDELPGDVDFTARFVRGDESRTDGGSGLGLSIARTFTEACGGDFRIEVVADLFAAVVSFPLTEERPSELE